MAVHAPARSTQPPASATNRPLTPSSFPTTTTTDPSHATLNHQIDSLLTTIESNTHRLALEAAYDPAIPFHPGCKDCVRDYVRHIRGAEPLKAAVQAAAEGEKAKVEWEKKEKTVVKDMREGREEEVGRWEERVRVGMEGKNVKGKEEGKQNEKPAGVAVKDAGLDGATTKGNKHTASSSSPSSLPKASKPKSKPSGQAQPAGGRGPAGASSSSTAHARPQAGPSTARGLTSSASSNTNALKQFSRYDIEGAEQAFDELDEDQQMAILLNVPW